MAGEAVMMETRKYHVAEIGEVRDSMNRKLGNPPQPGAVSTQGIDFRHGFSWGRETRKECPRCSSSQSSDCNQQLPDPELGCSENNRVFRENLGLTWRATAALM